MAPDFNTLRRLVLAAINDRVVPGLVIAAGQGGQVSVLEAFGQRQVEPEPATATVETVYDLASLTKAVVTSLLVMKGVGDGLLQLDRPLGDHLAVFAGRPEVTLRRVLAHAGGFPAHRKFYDSAVVKTGAGQAHRSSLINLAAAEPLVYQPGSQSIYSDLGFILLGALVEQVMSERLDVLAERLLFQPLGLSTLGFVDLLAAGPQAKFRGHDVAPTERCPVRGRMVVGEVHDLNAFAMGGIAGHAGLFGGIQDLLQLAFALCAAYHGRGVVSTDINQGVTEKIGTPSPRLTGEKVGMRGPAGASPSPQPSPRGDAGRGGGVLRSPQLDGRGTGGGAPIVRREILREFWRPAGIPGSTWRLGWDGPAAQGSLAGTLISRQAVGHLSFTGCSLWIDPEQEACVVVLTNRIHPEVRDDPRFRALRPALNDAALQAIGYRAG